MKQTYFGRCHSVLRLQLDMLGCLVRLAMLLPGVAVALSDNPELSQELQFLQAEATSDYVLSATRTLENVKKVGATVTVISRQQILEMGARNLMDVLSTVNGLGVTQNSLGMPEIEVRGVKTPYTEKVLFMRDSHPVNQSLVNGGAFWVSEPFLAENVARIEIVRGPGSALYGANAFLAVVNVITRDHTENTVEVSAGGGSFDTQKYNVFASKQIDKLGVALNANFFDTEGQRGFVNADVAGNSGPVLDGKQNWDIDLKLSANDFSLHGNFVQNRRQPFIGIANGLNDESGQRYLSSFLELKYDHQFTDRYRLNAKTYYDFFRLNNFWELFPEGFGGGAFPDGVLTRSAVNNSKIGVDIGNHYAFNAANKLVFGGLFEQQRQWDVEFDANFNPMTFAPLGSYRTLDKSFDWTDEVTRDVFALYAEDIWDMTRDLRLTVGGRYDHYSDFGGTLNPRSTLVWEFIDDYRLRLSYGRAFRAPTFAELYNKNNPAIVGNRHLDPETIDTYEVGLIGDPTSSLHFGVTGFRNEIRDIIVPSARGGAANVHANAGSIEAYGVESEWRWRFSAGSYLAGQYTYQHAENANMDQHVADIPHHRGSLLLNVQLPYQFNWHAQMLLKGSTSRVAGDLRTAVAGYGLVNTSLRASNLFKRNGLNVSASIFNLLDKTYVDPSPLGSTISDFPKPGRTFFIEVSTAF